MADWLGDYTEDHTTVTCMFTTHSSTGAPVAPLTAFEAADVIIYKNGSGTQKTTTNGVTMTSPFDSITGLHCVVIDTSNDTGDAAFWVAGAVYTIVLSPDTETVDGVAVAKVVGQFGIELAGALRPTTASRKLDVSAGGEAGVDWANIGSPTTTVNLSGTSTKALEPTTSGRTLDVTATGEAGIDWANIGGPTTTVNLSGTTVAAVTGAVGSVTGLTASDVGSIKTKTDFLPSATAGAAGGVFIAGTNAATTVTTSFTTTFTGNLTGSVGSIATGGIAAASFATGAIDAAALAADAGTEIGTAVWATTTRLLTAGTNIVLAKGVGVTGFNDLSAAQVNAEADTALADYDGPTHTELTAELATADDVVLAAIAALNNLSAAQVNAEVDTALADINLDHLVKIAVDTDFATTVHLNSVVGQLADNGTTATFDRTTDSQEAIRDRGDAAWITATGFSTHSAADVWAVGTRLLTAGTNIVLAKGTGVTGFTDLSAAQVNAEVDTALADYDGPTHAELTAELAAADDATLAAIAALSSPTASQIADEVWNSSTRDGALKSLSIVNADGVAMYVSSGADHGLLVEAGGNHDAIKATGVGGGSGMFLVGGASGSGLRAQGGGSEFDIKSDEIQAIQDKTDQLSFTVPNVADVNIQFVNDVEVNGDGSPSTPWGP